MSDTRKIAEKIADTHMGFFSLANVRRERVKAMADAIDEALRNERERCAKIAETARVNSNTGRQVEMLRANWFNEGVTAAAAAIRNDKEDEDGNL